MYKRGVKFILYLGDPFPSGFAWWAQKEAAYMTRLYGLHFFEFHR